MDSPALNATLPALNNSSVIGCLKLLEGFWAFFTILVFLLGFPLSIWVLWDLVDKHYRGGQPWTPNTVFTLNVTVMDLVFLAYLPVDVNIIFIENKILMKIGFVTSGVPWLWPVCAWTATWPSTTPSATALRHSPAG
jgi:hypothetical protein